MKKKLERLRRLLRPPSRPLVLGSGSARTPRASRNRLGRCGGCRHRARSTPGSGPTMSGGYLAQRFCTAYDQAYAKDATPGPGSYENESDRHGLGITCVCRSASQFSSELKLPRLRRARPSTFVARGRPPAHSRAYIHTRSMGFALRLRRRHTGCRVRRATTRSATSARPLAHRSGHHPSEVPACLPVHCQICAPQRQRKHDDGA